MSLVSQQVPHNQQLQQLFHDFLDKDIANGDATPDTVRTYLTQIRQYCHWCLQRGVDVAQASISDLKAYRHWMVEVRRYKPATIALKLAAVRRFYQAAIHQGWLSFNPALGIQPPREKLDRAEKITYLEAEEVQIFLDAIPDTGDLKSLRDRFLLSVMVVEGCRTVEMHRANLSSLVQQGPELGIRVEGKRNIRVVPLTPQLRQLLIAYLKVRSETGEILQPHHPLLIAVGNRARGQRLSRRGIRLVVDGYLEQVNLKYRPGRTLTAHSLRHTAGTLALRAGADLRQVQDLLGHADPKTTMLYTHVADRWENNPGLKLEELF